ncbi:hypothetical protein FE257_007513 [Aspergillus nanangensis]|uniref:DNA polymerase lambda n=1 Tax=Aspergillus nanangensis TaxID=2582783 RepID=A0AAD4CMF4_ASPNN|nr:hypothetical protein FE257_007513 [Aspergillus nanangensis]
MANTSSDKERFFKGLELLDHWSDDNQAEDDFGHLIALSKGTNNNDDGGSHHQPQQQDHDAVPPKSPALLRRSTTPAVLQSSPLDFARLGENTSIVPSITRSYTVGATAANTTRTMTTGKRKRSSPPRVVPENQQVLKGLVFFFFPNSDISPLRRLRIQRAQEYGALWARAWRDDVTHVIVDKGLTFQDVLKHLKLDALPADIALLDESYPSECIKFRSLLSTTHARFRISGMSVAPEVKDILHPSKHVTELLPVKQPGGKPQPETQSQASHEYSQVPQDQEQSSPKELGKQPLRLPCSGVRDILDDIIDETRAIKHLPLESLDYLEDGTEVEASDAETSEHSGSESAIRKKRSLSQKGADSSGNWQQIFACMQRHDAKSNTNNPNHKTIETLQQMLDYYTRMDDHWRVLAYRKAISALRRQPKKISSRAQALTIPGIGTRLADKIEEIVVTNRLRRLENTSTTAEDRILQDFVGVYGAGIAQASRWLAQGYRSLEDLKNSASLTRTQLIGINHYHDFLQRIPRKEVEVHGDFVRSAVQKVNPDMQVIISGSYRRGAVDSGDIDVLITKPDASIEQIRELMVDIVVPQLFQQGFLQASLVSTSRGDGSKWHGASKLPDNPIWRRIDLLFVPGTQIGAALIYFTGNDIFNRSMRLLARKKGMRLNQRGLYTDVLRGPQRTKMNPGRLLEGRDERRIFEILGVPWRPPEHRIC